MKVLVYGSAPTINRLKPIFETFQVKMQTLESADYKKMNILERWDDVDMVVVDTIEQEAELVCNYFGREKRVPLALFVDRSKADWAGLFRHGAYAYIPCEIGERELATRLKKVLGSISCEI
jgi:hypothetical protein